MRLLDGFVAEDTAATGERLAPPPLPERARGLAERIATRDAMCAVVGQGRAGFPLAEQIAAAGYAVYGYDTASAAIERCVAASRQSGYQAVHHPGILGDCDIVVVAAPTPTRRDSAGRCPDYSALLHAVRTLTLHLPEDGRARLIIVESTVPPGTTRGLIAPALAATFALGETLFLGYAPSRADATSEAQPLAQMPALTSGLDPAAAYLTWLFFQQVVTQPVPASSLEAAEAARMLEQAFRFINIAFAREFARYCARHGIAAAEVTALAASRPSGFLSFTPDDAVNGTPLADDPYYLFEAMLARGNPPAILGAAIRAWEAAETGSEPPAVSNEETPAKGSDTEPG